MLVGRSSLSSARKNDGRSIGVVPADGPIRDAQL